MARCILWRFVFKEGMASAFGFPRVVCHEEALESVEGL